MASSSTPEPCPHSVMQSDCASCWWGHSARLDKRLGRAEEVIKFYADPETYFAIGIFPDPPCGEFMDDISDTGPLGMKPGKRARAWEEEYL